MADFSLGINATKEAMTTANTLLVEGEVKAQAAAAQATEPKNQKTRYTGYISADKWQKFCRINDCRDMSNTSTMNMLIDEYIARFKDLLEGYNR